MKKEKTVKSYDETPYFGSSYPETHPSHLASLAILFGMKPAPVNKCRVLDLGTGDGTNLIPMACAYPDSQFIGVDLSINEVKRANETIQALKLKNIEILHHDILEVNKDFGQFDYIIAHGVYSWVPNEVRHKMLGIIRDRLADNGIAFVSYNTYPGWYMPAMLREMMLYHIHSIKDPEKYVTEARRFMKFLSEASIRGTPFSDFIKDEVKRTESWSDSFFRHDTLGDINQPFYFHEFMSAANQAGLQYLSESEYHSTVIDNFSPFIKEYLTKLDGDPVFREQHVDFIQNRIFRETLLCCESARLDRQIETSRFKSLFFAASVQPLSASLSINSETIEDFKAPDQTILSVSDPLAKAVLKVFADHWPKPVNYEELFSGVNKLLDKKHILRPGQLLLLLKRNFTVGLLKIFSEDVSLVKTISKKPKVSDLVRYQAAHQLWVTNQLHEYVPIDNLGHHILPLLNGQNDMDALVNALFEIVRQGKITLQKAGEKLIEPDQIKSVLREQLVFSLDQFASRALLIK